MAVLAALAIAAGGHSRGAAGALPRFQPCDHARRFVLCGTVPVPLDPSGRHGGSVLLHVEELPAPLVPRAAPLRLAFLVAGGPGQASAASFDLEDSGHFLQSLLPGYIL